MEFAKEQRDASSPLLEALKRERAGQYIIRVNDQFRVCFRWTEAGPAEVGIVDYHQECCESVGDAVASDQAMCEHSGLACPHESNRRLL